MKLRLATTLLLAPALLAQDHATLTLDRVEWTTADRPDLQGRIGSWDVHGWPQPEVRIAGAEEAWLGLPATSPRGQYPLRLGDIELSRKGAGNEGELWLRGSSGEVLLEVTDGNALQALTLYYEGADEQPPAGPESPAPVRACSSSLGGWDGGSAWGGQVQVRNRMGSV